MERDEAFQVAIARVFPAVVQAEMHNPERYAIGNLVYHSARPTIVSWRKQNVKFATEDGGAPASLSSIISPECPRVLSQLRPQSTLFSNTGSRETEREFTIQRAGQRRQIRASFGAVYQTTSNLLGLLESTSGEQRADLGNAVVQKVVENGGGCFVVSTVYEAEKVHISERDDSSEEKWRKVVSKPDKTVFGFLLVRLAINSESGVIRVVWHGGYTPHSISIEESEDGSLGMGGDFEDVDFAFAYRQCGRREFQVFQSDSYAGVIEEAAKFVEALTVNSALQKAFIEVVKKPTTALVRLSQELQALHERLVTGLPEGASESSQFPELLGQLSKTSPHTLDQVKALAIAAEAFKELLPVTAKRILSLTSEEKGRLFSLFSELPLMSSAHVFYRPAPPESDLLFSDVLERIGFGATGGRLSYESDEFGADLIAVTITAVQATSIASE